MAAAAAAQAMHQPSAAVTKQLGRDQQSRDRRQRRLQGRPEQRFTGGGSLLRDRRWRSHGARVATEQTRVSTKSYGAVVAAPPPEPSPLFRD